MIIFRRMQWTNIYTETLILILKSYSNKEILYDYENKNNWRMRSFHNGGYYSTVSDDLKGHLAYQRRSPDHQSTVEPLIIDYVTCIAQCTSGYRQASRHETGHWLTVN